VLQTFLFFPSEAILDAAAPLSPLSCPGLTLIFLYNKSSFQLFQKKGDVKKF
jgi:hypothetical protein